MSLRRTASRALALAAVGSCLLIPPALGADDPPTPRVTGAVQVTDNPNVVRAHITPLIARNPKTGELVVAEVDARGTRECAVHVSADGGRSWALGGSFMVKPFTDCSIGAEFGPHVAPFFDRDGVLNVAFTANDPARLASDRPVSTTDVREDIPRNAYLARSTDSGRTFSTVLVAAGKEGNTQTAYIDAPFGAVDPINPRNVYVSWGQGDWSNEKDPIQPWLPPPPTGDAPSVHRWRSTTTPAPTTPSSPSTARVSCTPPTGSRGVGTEGFDPTQTRINGRRNPSPLMHAWSADQGRTWERNVLDPGNQRIYRAAPSPPTPSRERSTRSGTSTRTR